MEIQRLKLKSKRWKLSRVSRWNLSSFNSSTSGDVSSTDAANRVVGNSYIRWGPNSIRERNILGRSSSQDGT